MKYISTKQTAELWSVSPRRVALLASQGRIEGAVSMGNTWLIPEGAQKPADSRKKPSSEAPNSVGREVYPFIPVIINSEARINSLSPEERELYRACKLHENVELYESFKICEGLLSSKNLNIHMGALYLLACDSLYLSDYASAEKYSLLFRTEYHEIDRPSVIMRMLYYSFEAEMGRTSELLDCDVFSDSTSIDHELLPFFSGQKLYVEMVRYNLQGKPLDISPYIVICRMVQADGYYNVAQFMHTLLSLYYAGQGNSANELFHIRQALDICHEYNEYFSFSCLISSCPETVESVLKDYPPELEERIRTSIEIFLNSRVEYAEYRRRKSRFSKLREEDYRLISCCLRNYSINEMAERFGLSRSGINRRLAMLYAKVGVDSQRELKKVILTSALEWDNT